MWPSGLAITNLRDRVFDISGTAFLTNNVALRPCHYQSQGPSFCHFGVPIFDKQCCPQALPLPVLGTKFLPFLGSTFLQTMWPSGFAITNLRDRVFAISGSAFLNV